ncbi:hypothetical protein NDU88_004498 [Pleurodeles waltl]|uniref:Uncharacterized protein n=1 Tax=Pleurodeles waltl TaxID=8319 RepID=A0AAV7TSU7_PLEWA|nr:hypothetical protein NDU88_004498 [Pleurodeles waltl]
MERQVNPAKEIVGKSSWDDKEYSDELDEYILDMNDENDMDEFDILYKTDMGQKKQVKDPLGHTLFEPSDVKHPRKMPLGVENRRCYLTTSLPLTPHRTEQRLSSRLWGKERAPGAAFISTGRQPSKAASALELAALYVATVAPSRQRMGPRRWPECGSWAVHEGRS